MRIQSLLLAILCLCFFNNIQAQKTQRTCGTDEYHQHQLQDSEYAKQFEKISKAQKELLNKSMVPCGTPIIIPIAIHYGSPINASNTTCIIDAALAQVAQLNLDFSSCNANVSDWCDFLSACPSYFSDPNGGDVMPEDGTCFQFCLADQNLPAGQDNIGGYAITVDDHTWPSVPGSTWDDFLNVFVSSTSTAGVGGGTLGVAPLNGGANPNGNGVYVVNTAFGAQGFPSCTSGGPLNNNNSYNGGATLTHELGHYFGLQHTFSDSYPDTPPQSSPNFNCPTLNTTSCTTSVGNDYGFNFMDYVDDDCMSNFSADQTTIMNNVVANQTSWATASMSCYADWLNGTNVYSSCQGECSGGPTAAFTPNSGNITLCGNSANVSFTDASTGAPTSWSWTFSGAGVSPSSSTNPNPTVSVGASGNLNVSLTVTNPSGSNTDSGTIGIILNDPDIPPCTFPPAVAINPAMGPLEFCLLPSDFTFMDGSTGDPATSWSWTFSGAGVSPTSSTAENPVVNFATGGTVSVSLTATNTAGSNTVSQDFSVIENPCPTVCEMELLRIPDNDPGGVSEIVTFLDGGPISDVNVEVDILHDNVGDLYVTLEHLGTTVVLIDRPGFPATNGGCSNSNITDCILDDESTNGTTENVCATGPPAITGIFNSIESLGAFNGVEKAGDWTLTVYDQNAPTLGFLEGFCLQVTTQVVENCLEMAILSGDISTIEDYESADFIETVQILLAGSAVDYDAVDYIILQAGFECVTGAEFEAFIDGCDNGGGGINLLDEDPVIDKH